VRAVVLTALALVALLIVNFFVLQQAQALVENLPTIGLLSLFILVYVLLFVRQAEARDRAQTLLAELEDAHRQLQAYADQVEELAITQERERMARELHDTLAQGVAGLIMQLEAVDSHLENDNPAKAQAVVQQAMHRARRTLDEARRAIQALRAGVLEQGSLVDALEQEIAQFEATTGAQASLETPSEMPVISPEKAQTILRVVQESLSNAARHAGANHVAVQLAKNDDELVISVQDDGPGFDPEEAMQKPGRFGLAGMQERAARLGGKLDVESAPGKGTRVTLRLGENA
jgi:NarL family two-component system sensor histidine kinase YdfH